jgi:hypothetical protein
MVASTIDWDELWTEPVSEIGGETLQATGTAVATDQDDLALLDAYSQAVVGTAERVGTDRDKIGILSHNFFKKLGTTDSRRYITGVIHATRAGRSACGDGTGSTGLAAAWHAADGRNGRRVDRRATAGAVRDPSG